MTLTPKQIAIGIAVVVAIIPTYFILRGRNAEPPVQQEIVVEDARDQLPTPTLVTDTETQNANSAQGAAAAKDIATIKATASAFVEQFGSYSSDTSFGNIISLKPQMTASFAAWADTYVADQRAKYPSGGAYYGVTTRVLNVTLGSGDGNVRNASVKTQRETTTNGKTELTYPSMELSLLYQDGGWKVDSATWKE